jgi:hypothetical protein
MAGLVPAIPIRRARWLLIEIAGTSPAMTPNFEPPAAWSREEVLAASDAVLALAPGAVKETEDIFRLAVRLGGTAGDPRI